MHDTKDYTLPRADPRRSGLFFEQPAADVFDAATPIAASLSGDAAILGNSIADYSQEFGEDFAQDPTGALLNVVEDLGQVAAEVAVSAHDLAVTCGAGALAIVQNRAIPSDTARAAFACMLTVNNAGLLSALNKAMIRLDTSAVATLVAKKLAKKLAKAAALALIRDRSNGMQSRCVIYSNSSECAALAENLYQQAEDTLAAHAGTCVDKGGSKNYCSSWCNTPGIWGCGNASHGLHSCDCTGCNGCGGYTHPTWTTKLYDFKQGSTSPAPAKALTVHSQRTHSTAQLLQTDQYDRPIRQLQENVKNYIHQVLTTVK